MSINLSTGCVSAIFQSQQPQRPIVQLVDVKRISHPNQGERFRLIISDGTHYTQGMLSTQSAFLVNTNQVTKNSVVQLDEYMLNNIQGKKIVIVLRCSVVLKDAAPIGQPVNVADSAPVSAPTAHGVGYGGGGGGGYGMHRAQPPPVPPPQAMSGGPGSWGSHGRSFNAPPSRMDDNFQPITTLNPYQNGWKIKARVTAKSGIRHWKNARGDGKLFSVDLLDRHGGEMRATMFNDACDKFYGILEVNKVYAISKGVIKMARKQFTHLKNDYEMTLNADADVVPLGDDTGIENQRYSFVKIADVQTVAPNSYVDILGIVLSVQPPQKVMSQKSQKELDKRSIVLGDDTATIELTLWNEHALEYDEKQLQDHPVVAIRGARVSDFGGRSLSCGASPPSVWPQRPEAQALQRWFTQSGGLEGGALRHVQNLTSIAGGIGGANAPVKTFAEVKEEEIGMHVTEEKKAEYFSVCAWITAVSHSPDRPPWYLACPADSGQNFKVIDAGNGTYLCEKLDRTFTSYTPRYIVRFQCMDFSGQQWMSAFHDVAEKMLGVPCTEAEAYLKNNQLDEFNRVFTSQTFKRVMFKCRAKCDRSWQDEVRLRVDALDFQEVDSVEKSKEMLEKVKMMMVNRGIQF